MNRLDSSVDILDRMCRAVEKVRDRLLRATAALENAGVRYALIGGNAVAAWVATVDESAVRNTQDVDLLLERDTFETAKTALESAGFFYRHIAGVDLFLDGENAKARDAVHIIFAQEKVRPDYHASAPDTSETVLLNDRVRVVALKALVRMKLTSYRRKDQVHLLDLIDVGLLSDADLADLPPILADRLRELLEHPDS
ncbi:MAG: hypothetical protein NTX50_16595 [Candidatus Sumerlaeota bacterium]|nr:hypothetical protein [Candidatus Sumerlaeota bacterium]